MGIAVDNYGNDISGATDTRPTSPYVGSMFFDEDLGVPIWWDGTQWVISAGTPASLTSSAAQPQRQQAAQPTPSCPTDTL